MVTTILNSFQQKTLQKFIKSSLAEKFYLSGGTALSEFYLKHRKSEDLDFFTQEEMNLEELKRFINFIASKNQIQKIEFQHGFGLYTFFLTASNKILHKIDFGQYPFEPLNPVKIFNGLNVESLEDIAVNKAHTIAFHPRYRDFIDIYFILQKEQDWNFPDLLKKSFIKFEMKADPLQIGQNLILVKEQKDLPIMLKKINILKMQDFFLQIAKDLQKDILV